MNNFFYDVYVSHIVCVCVCVFILIVYNTFLLKFFTCTGKAYK